MSALLRLRGYQQQALDDLREKWKTEGNRLAIVLPTGGGKGHPLDTEVPTPDGFRRWGDLNPGDLVYGSSGRPVRVSAVYDRGVLPTYLVRFSDGSEVKVDGDHLWRVKDATRRRTSREWVTVTTEELRRSDLKLARGWRWQIPITGEVDRDPVDLPLDPYVVGALLANGGLAHSGTILTTPDRDVAARVAEAVQCNRIADATDVCERYSLPGLTRITEALGMRVKSSAKRIPSIYLTGSVDQRLALLQGLMDGDGSMRDPSRRSVEYHTTSPGLAADVVELVTSLGGTGIVKGKVRADRPSGLRQGDRPRSGASAGTGEAREAVGEAVGVSAAEYAVGIVLPVGMSAFSSARKSRAGTASVRNLSPRRSIVAIEPVGSEAIRCISVDATDRLYLITRNHIVTHNTVCFAHLAAEHLRDHPGTRVLVLVHTDELVNQAYNKVKAIAPHLEAGIVKASRREVGADVIVASVQSLRSEARRNEIQHVSLVIVDECHHSTSRTYKAILEHYGCMVKTLAAGFTATLERGDGGSLGEIWQGVAFQRDISWMVRKGYLIPPRGKRIEVPELDLGRVRVSGGDFREGDLSDALVNSLAPEVIAKKFVEHASDRKAIAFLPTVESAYVMRDAFLAEGVTAEVLHGGLGTEERRSTLARFAAGEVRVLVNCMILTEGFDAPEVDCVIVARPTKSKPLYIQMVGRGLRVDPARPYAEQDCLLMDVVGVSARMDLRSMADLSTKNVKPPRDGQTLLDLEDAFDLEDQGFEPDPEHHYRGPVDVKDFDPIMTRSSRAWLKTKGDGVYFLKAGEEAYVFLVQLHDGWAVVWCTASGQPYVCRTRMHDDCADRHRKAGGVTGHRGLDLEMAMTWGEDLAVDMGADPMETLTRKTASWRRGKPSGKTKNLATNLKIEFTESTKAGELSDRISRELASKRINHLAAGLIERRA